MAPAGPGRRRKERGAHIATLMENRMNFPRNLKHRVMHRIALARNAAVTVAVLALSSGSADAQMIGTNYTCGEMGWDHWIGVIVGDLTGPVTVGVGVVAALAAGFALAFGEDLSGIGKRALQVVLAISFIPAVLKLMTLMGLSVPMC